MAKRAEPTEGMWEIHAGVPRAKNARRKIGAVEDLHYNNPYGYTIERVWFEGKVIFATEQGEVFAIRHAGLTAVAVTERFALASLLFFDMRALLRDLAAGGDGRGPE